MRIIFDVGMFDGADTAYYLELGYRVVAVEANPDLIAKAALRFAKQVESGQLTLVNRAIGPKNSAVELVIAGDDLGSSSVYADRVANKSPRGTVTVPTVTFAELVAQYGVPYFMKVDIEGADRECILAITPENRPQYLSFEAGDDVEELLEHVERCGYKLFKAIDQCSFLPIDEGERLYDRVALKVMRALGYDHPLLVRRAGRFFRMCHSSGPVPWKAKGQWSSAELLRSKFRLPLCRIPGHWYDVHAALA